MREEGYSLPPSVVGSKASLANNDGRGSQVGPLLMAVKIGVCSATSCAEFLVFVSFSRRWCCRYIQVRRPDLLKPMSTATLSRRVIPTGISLVCLAGPVFAATGEVRPIPLAEFNAKAGGGGWANASFRIEGVVCDVSEDRRLLVLQDASGALLLEYPRLPAEASVGKGLAVVGEGCMVATGRFGVRLVEGALAVDVDGYHPFASRSGSALLKEGLQPLRLDWFNGRGYGELKLEYEGPEISKASLPASAFMHTEDSGAIVPGLRYRAFVNDRWYGVDDMSSSVPMDSGVAQEVGLDILRQTDEAGLSFEGFLRVPRTGSYTFHLGSDDGSRLVVGEGRVSFDVLPGLAIPIETEKWTGAVSASKPAWVKGRGVVLFSSRMRDQLELEIADQDLTYRVTILKPGALDPSKLLYRRVELSGLGRPEGITVIGPGILASEGDAEPADLLTQAIQIRRLQPEEANKHHRVRIRGVVTMSRMARDLVIQDASGGVFVRYEATDPEGVPRPGEVWEIEGITIPGDFSPMIVDAKARYCGKAPMIRAARPSWDQLANGSMDAEVVEVEGVVVSTSALSLELQTRDGLLSILDIGSYPLPTRSLSEEELAVLPGSVVRIRGVYKAEWDDHGLVRTGVCLLGNALMTVDDPAPENPFALPVMPVSDLRLFTSHAGPFKRVKVTGQVLQSRPPLLFLSDGQSGFRVVSRDAALVGAGDLVEVAGFPRVGRVTPELVEARVLRTDTAPLPKPLPVTADDLMDSRLDATRVEVEATLLNNLRRNDERMLEVEAGSRRFIARLTSGQVAEPLRQGSVLKLLGTYAASSSANSAGGVEGFELLMSSPADLIVLRHGPWWTKGHTIATIGVLSGGILIAGGWVLLLRRAVRLRTGELAKEIEERQAAERHREMEQERSRVAHDLHDELGAALTEVGMLASLAKSMAVPEPKKDGYLDRLIELSRGTVTALDEIVWAVNPCYDSVADLAEYFSLFAQRFLELPGIRCRPRISETVAAHPLASQQRHGIFLAFKEALNNIVRHSQATEVLLSIDVEEGTLRIRLSDNGCGFDPSDIHSLGSDGLVNMSERMTSLGGRCDVSAEPGNGVVVELRLPLERSKS